MAFELGTIAPMKENITQMLVACSLWTAACS
jgi:hypothetical protein